MVIKILCVDESIDNLKVIRKVLKPLNYEIIQSTDGKQALKVIYGERLDLILLGVRSLNLTALEILKNIEHYPNVHSVPIVIVSNKNDKEQVWKAIAMGAVGCIFFPIHEGKTIQKIKYYLAMPGGGLG